VLAVGLASLRERWTLFLGAGLTVALGVALVQSSLLLLLTAATAAAPAGASPVAASAHAASTVVAVTVLAVTLAFAAFLALFIIGTTFAFTVDQRIRELALLRLVGAGRRQVRRLLVVEAAVLGGIGAVAGVPLGLLVTRVHAELLVRLGFVPAGFAAEWRWWILGVAAVTGVGLAVGGVLLAARRASAILPLAALREDEPVSRVMTRGRWITALLAGAGAIALLVLAPIGGPAGGQAMALNVSIAAAIALTAAAPLLVPLAARLVPVRRTGALALLARAALRDAVRRSASTAAPVVILVGILVGQSTALLSGAAAGATELRAATEADLVVASVVDDASSRPGHDGIASAPGVASASTEVTVPAAITTGSGPSAFTETGTVTVIDPVAFARAHPGSGPSVALAAGTAAPGPGAIMMAAGDEVGVRVGDVDLGSRVIASAAAPSLAAGPTLYLPAAGLPSGSLAGAPVVTFVSVLDGEAPDAVAAALAPYGSVEPLDAWLDRQAMSGTSTASSILVVVLGLGALYAVLGVVNSVVIAGASRRREFAIARASGLTRSQVVRTALLESSLVTAIGVGLGLLAASGTAVAMGIVTASVTGTATVVVPWALLGAVVLGAFVVTGVTSVLTTRAAVRPAPVELLRARE
jgi:putative ABC transport system permease protein